MTTDPPVETPEERRARKAAMKQANFERVQQEIAPMLAPLPHNLGFNELQLEHGRLRQKIVDVQTLAIQGQFDFAKAQEIERVLVEQIHKVEERARDMQTGKHVPKPGS